MIDLDIDWEALEKIRNPTVKSMLKQLSQYGSATVDDGKWNRVIAKKFPKLRDKQDPVLIIGWDRKTDRHTITPNWGRSTIENDLNKAIKDICRSFRNK